MLTRLVAELCAQPDAPHAAPLALSALRGMPGVGKTALAMAVANSPQIRAAFLDGVAWLALGPQPDLFALLGQLLSDFGAPTADLIDADSRAVRLRRTLSGKRCLLILDDVWRKTHAQPFLEAIRPPARALFTTRRPQVASDLHAANHEVPVLQAAPALKLLAAAGSDAAEAVDANRSGASQLAADLGGLPLALKVAGRRLQALARSGDPRTAVQQLRGEVERRLLALTTPEAHPGLAGEEPSLDAILALSYDALPDDATRRALRGMAVCGGQPLDVDAACLAAVWQVDAEQAQTLIATLVDAGLLEVSRRQGAPRYALHQVMGVFAAARLAADAAEQQAAMLAHAAHFADLVAGYDAAIEAGRMTYSAPLEWANVVHAIETLCRLAAHNDAAGHALLAFAQNWRMILLSNPAPRHLQWLNRAVECAARLGDAWQQANVLKAQGDVLAFLDERAQALEKYEEALGLFRAVGDRLGEANVLKAQGDVLYFLKQTAQALEKYEEALGLFRAVGDRLGEANVLKAQGDVALRGREVELGLALLDRAFQLYEVIGARVGTSNVGIVLARYTASQGDWEAAIRYMQPAADFGREIGHPLGDALQAEIDQWQTQLHFDTLSVLRQQENWGELARAATTLIEQGEGDGNVWQALADARSNLNDEAGAADAYAQAVALQPETAMLRRNFANTLIHLGRLDEAADQLAVAERLDPDAAYLALRRAELAQAHGDGADAARWAQVALQRQPDWDEAQAILAWAQQP